MKQPFSRDVVQYIFNFVDRRDLRSHHLVCKRWKEASLPHITTLKRNPPRNEDLKPFKYLKTLYLSNNSSITNEGLKWVRNLQTLSLTNNSTITDEGLTVIIS